MHDQENYFIGYHPHGALAVGAVVCFGTRIYNATQLTPGIDSTVQTLPFQFMIPVWRELLIGLGAGDASKEAILHRLQGQKGTCTCVAIGGAAEALFVSRDGKARLLLRSRKGFIKLAMQAGAHLVPVYAFGEDDIYDNLGTHSTCILLLQRRLQKWIGFSPFIPRGSFFFLPRRRPVSVVMGSPLKVEKYPHPEREPALVDYYHKRYIEAVIELYRTYAPLFAESKVLDIL